MATRGVYSPMKRRKYVRAAGVAIGAVSLAGCGTNPGAETDQEPDDSESSERTTARGPTTSDTATTTAEPTTTGTTSSPDGESTTGSQTQTNGSGGSGGSGGGGPSTPTTPDETSTDEVRSTTAGTPARGTTGTPPDTSDS